MSQRTTQLLALFSLVAVALNLLLGVDPTLAKDLPEGQSEWIKFLASLRPRSSWQAIFSGGCLYLLYTLLLTRLFLASRFATVSSLSIVFTTGLLNAWMGEYIHIQADLEYESSSLPWFQIAFVTGVYLSVPAAVLAFSVSWLKRRKACLVPIEH